jgi:tetratricopeptide (TPR) repeat protein
MSKQIEEARLLYETKKLDKAIEAYETLVKEYPDNALAHEGLARCFLAKNKTDDAVKESVKALELDGSLLLPHRVLANVYQRQKRFDLYEQELRTIMDRDENLADVNLALGALLIHLNRAQDGYKYIRRSIELNPSLWHARAQLISLYLTQSNYKEALREAKTAFELKKSFATAQLLLGVFLVTNRFWLFPLFAIIFVLSLLIPSPLSYLLGITIGGLMLFSIIGHLESRNLKFAFYGIVILIVYILAWVYVHNAFGN